MDMRLQNETAGTDWLNQMTAAVVTRRGAMYAVRLPDGSVATCYGYNRGDGIVPLCIAMNEQTWATIPHLAGDDDVQPFQS